MKTLRHLVDMSSGYGRDGGVLWVGSSCLVLTLPESGTRGGKTGDKSVVQRSATPWRPSAGVTGQEGGKGSRASTSSVSPPPHPHRSPWIPATLHPLSQQAHQLIHSCDFPGAPLRLPAETQMCSEASLALLTLACSPQNFPTPPTESKHHSPPHTQLK